MKEEVILFSDKKTFQKTLQEKGIIQIQYNQQKYCVTKVGQSVYVFEPKCPHFDYPLIQAKVNAFSKVVCPWHGYQFDLTNGEEQRHRCRALDVRLAYWNEKEELVVKL